MTPSSKLSFALLLGAVVSAAAEWPNLVTTFGPIPGLNPNWYDPQPRTLNELTEDGWVQISSCADEHPNFPGDRFVRSEADKDMVIILDGNGYIAGMQSVVMKEKVTDEFINYFDNPYYVLDAWFSEEAYFTTAYFVDTAIICNGGRTEEEFIAEGTGNRLSFQNGPTNSDLQEIPLTEEGVNDSDEWYVHLCFDNMGYHIFSFPPSADASPGGALDCTDVAPWQVLYFNGILNGFVFQHSAAMLDSPRFEHPVPQLLGNFAIDPPQCVVDLSKNPGSSTLHVWVGDYFVACE